MRYVNKSGHVKHFKDRTRGIYPYIDIALSLLKKIASLFLPKISNVGTFVYVDGKWKKVKERATIKDKIRYINGDEDVKAAYASLERKGKLRKVNDDWQAHAKR